VTFVEHLIACRERMSERQQTALLMFTSIVPLQILRPLNGNTLRTLHRMCLQI